MQRHGGFDLCLSIALWLSALAGVAQAADVEAFPGTKSLTIEGDLASQMVDGIDRFLMRQIDESIPNRGVRKPADSKLSDEDWKQARRKQFAKSIGIVDERVKFDGLELVGTSSRPARIAKGAGFYAYQVRWPVLPGVHGEGLLLTFADLSTEEGMQHLSTRGTTLIAIPDADQSPEMLAGLETGERAIPAEAQFARRLAEQGYHVIVPCLIDRSDKYSVGAGGTRPTNQPAREFIYRQSYELGRHVIGYEVQKILALVDWQAGFVKQITGPVRTGVIGYGEGGLLALYAAAIDERITSTCVSGYFASRQRVWDEPIYRNVFGLLRDFGDAELAALVAPRLLIVESCRAPELKGPPNAKAGGGAAPGRLSSPTVEDTAKEVDRARSLGGADKRYLPHLMSGDGNGAPGSVAALKDLIQQGSKASIADYDAKPAEPERFGAVDPQRGKRQFDELVDYTQKLLAESEYTRDKFWEKADRKSRSVEKWQETSAPYRDYFYKQVIGRFEIDKLPPNVRTRKVYDEPKFTGYEVMLDVFPDVFAHGILLVPKDIKEGEKRPVVVCQHGLEGRPQDVADPKINSPYYNQYAIRLAERGFITYAPQNPYIFQDRFRVLQRKLNPLGKTLFSIIVPQHEQTVDWLASLPMVDAEKIAFYGLSYGGKTAMRVPALVEKYCLSICSADFNEWIWKNSSARSPYSYLHTGEYEMFEFDLGNTFNYAEMAGLIAPRPFMVERGHRDGVAPDPWVAYEYAKVRLLYADLKIPERTTIEFFDGPHTIHGVETFEFLEKHLRGK